MFDSVRAWAYRHVLEFSSFNLFGQAVISQCELINSGFDLPLSYGEVKSSSKSVTKWVWNQQLNFAGREVNRGAYGCTRKEAGAMTAEGRRSVTRAKIVSAIGEIATTGKVPTHAAIASACEISSKTVQRHMKQMAVLA